MPVRFAENPRELGFSSHKCLCFDWQKLVIIEKRIENVDDIAGTNKK